MFEVCHNISVECGKWWVSSVSAGVGRLVHFGSATGQLIQFLGC
jgi:hypothetical protein